MPDETTQTNAIATKEKHRSPNYPAFDLAKAVERARQFYDQHKQRSVYFDVAVATFGQKSTSSSGMRLISTLVSYGLLTDQGKGATRQLKLSPEAYQLLVVCGDDDIEERVDLLRKMAAKPKVYAELIQRYPSGLPLDAAIQKVLKAPPLSFNPDAVAEVTRDFRATYEYAQIGISGILSEAETDKGADSDGHDDEESETPPAGIAKPQVKPPGSSAGGKKKMEGQLQTRTFAIPMQGGREILLQAPETPKAADIPYLALLKSYIDLMLKQAEMNTQADESSNAAPDSEV